MKHSAKQLPFIVEESLAALGKRISLARRARALTQPDLAEKAGISLSTLLAIEKGAPTVQIGSVFSALWALGLEGTFEALESVGESPELTALLADTLPQRVRGRRKLA